MHMAGSQNLRAPTQIGEKVREGLEKANRKVRDEGQNYLEGTGFDINLHDLESLVCANPIYSLGIVFAALICHPV